MGVIVAIYKGKGIRGLLNYVLDPAKGPGGNTRPAILSRCDLAGDTPRELAVAFGRYRAFTGKGKYVFDITFSWRDEECPDRAVRTAYIDAWFDQMGLGDTPRVAVEHLDADHINDHVVGLYLGSNGQRLHQGWDFTRSNKVSARLDVQFGLRIENRVRPGNPAPSQELPRVEVTKTLSPDRIAGERELASLLFGGALARAKQGERTWTALEQELKVGGLELTFVKKKNGEIQGIGIRTAAGSFFPGGKLNKDRSWSYQGLIRVHGIGDENVRSIEQSGHAHCTNEPQRDPLPKRLEESEHFVGRGFRARQTPEHTPGSQRMRSIGSALRSGCATGLARAGEGLEVVLGWILGPWGRRLMAPKPRWADPLVPQRLGPRVPDVAGPPDTETRELPPGGLARAGGPATGGDLARAEGRGPGAPGTRHPSPDNPNVGRRADALGAGASARVEPRLDAGGGAIPGGTLWAGDALQFPAAAGRAGHGDGGRRIARPGGAPGGRRGIELPQRHRMAPGHLPPPADGLVGLPDLAYFDLTREWEEEENRKLTRLVPVVSPPRRSQLEPQEPPEIGGSRKQIGPGEKIPRV